jgi:hypothetical protein
VAGGAGSPGTSAIHPGSDRRGRMGSASSRPALGRRRLGVVRPLVAARRRRRPAGRRPGRLAAAPDRVSAFSREEDGTPDRAVSGDRRLTWTRLGGDRRGCVPGRKLSAETRKVARVTPAATSSPAGRRRLYPSRGRPARPPPGSPAWIGCARPRRCGGGSRFGSAPESGPPRLQPFEDHDRQVAPAARDAAVDAPGVRLEVVDQLDRANERLPFEQLGPGGAIPADPSAPRPPTNARPTVDGQTYQRTLCPDYS